MSEPRTCWRCGEKPATICTTCQGDLAAYYDQQIENLTTPLAQAAPELLAACEALLKAVYRQFPAIEDSSNEWLERFVKDVSPQNSATARAVLKARKALARAEAQGSGEVETR